MVQLPCPNIEGKEDYMDHQKLSTKGLTTFSSLMSISIPESRKVSLFHPISPLRKKHNSFSSPETEFVLLTTARIDLLS